MSGRKESASDLQRAVELEKACDHGGDSAACYSLSSEYARGVVQRTCAAVFPPVAACSYLGERVGRNPAVALLQKACDGGQAKGCMELGLQYAYGQGVPEDAARPATLFQKACDGGSVQACVNLGSQYANGEGVEKDFARAAALYRKACTGGDA